MELLQQNYYSCILQKHMKKALLIILLILNVIVLLGQIWPAGAPPFARVVNIIFLTGSFLFFAYSVKDLKQ